MFRYLTKGKVGIPCWIFIFLAISAVSHAAETKIGCVDIQRALNESEAGKEAKKVMESELQKFQVEITQRQKELQTLKETLQRQGTMLSMKGKTEKEREYQNKLKEYKRWGEDRQNELKRKEVELTKEALRGLRAVVKKLGEEEKFTLILEKNEAIVLHVSGTIDLTDRVISIFNSTRSTKQ